MAAECVIPLDLVPKLAVAADANPKMAAVAVAASPAAVMVASAQPQPQQLQLVHFVVGSHHQFQFSGVAKADQLQIPGAMATVTDGATAAKRKKASPRSLSSSTSSSEVMSPAPSPMAAAAPTSEADSRCTICGQNFADNKSAFNAHIKAHLKEKLNNRRARAEKQMQQSKVAAATAPQSTPTGKINNQTAAAVASVATAAALGQVQQQSLVEKAASGSSPGQRKRKKPSTPPPHSPHPTANTPAPTTPRPAPSLATMQRPQSATAVLQKHPLLPPPLIGLPPPPPPPRPQTLQHSLASHHQVMAELAACKPIPPSQQQPQFLTATVSSEPLPPPLPLPAALKPQQAPQVPSTTLAAMSEITNPKKPEVALQNSTSISVVVKQQQEQQRHQQQQPSQPPTLPLDNLCTPEISDMEEDLMSYEMEMNRIDFHNDLSTILDQLEKDFESPGLMGDFMMDEMPPSQPAAMIDTPPDSDSEVYFQNPISPSAAAATSTLSAELQSLVAAAAAATAADDHASLKSKPPFPIVTSSSSVSSATSSSSEVTPYNGQLDLLGFDRFVRVQSAARPDAAAVSQQRTMESQQQAAASSSPSASGAMNAMTGSGCTVVQSPASLAKVGPLNPKALAVLSQLPSKLFPTGPGADSTRLVNVVKVENATTTNKVSSLAASAASISTTPSAVTPYTVINIECHQPGKNGEIEKKVLETYRAIETRGEIKLVAVGSTTVVSGEQPRTVAMGNCGGAGTYNYYNHNSQPEPSPMSTCSSSHDSAIDSPMSGMSTDENSVFERQATKKLSYPQSCIQCPEKFSKLSELLEHQITTHQNQEHRCERCGQAFSSHPGLLGHRRTHPECGLVVASSSSSRPEQQQLQQSRQKPFSCRSCKRSFTQRGHLNRHEKTHGAETGGKTKGAVATTTAWNDDFTCKVCGKRCKNNAGLARHRAKHLTCAQCAVSFDSKAALQDHLFKRHPESAVITVEKPPPPPPQSEHGDYDDDFESDLRTRSAMETATATRRGDSFLVSCCADEDDDEDQVQISGLAASLGSDGGSSSKGLSPDALGESLVDISDSNFFDFDKDLNDEFYSTADLF